MLPLKTGLVTDVTIALQNPIWRRAYILNTFLLCRSRPA